MQTISATSQLDIKRYYNLSLYLLYRKRFMLYLTLIVLVMTGGVIYNVTTGNFNGSDMWLGCAFVVFYLSMPLLIYRTTCINFKKIKSMSEIKTYTFDENNVTVQSESVDSNFKWSIISKAKERKNEFLLITENKMTVHYIPKNGFYNDAAIDDFRKLLIRLKKIK